ncbi:hypothetical protein [Catenuloplanes atrovinosus]|uniref:Uncharacterized protein n=1 Tax=Catenuloplanes atrovinosus TaxID=137266 RepID=A0AAE4CB60_9ACTN|nr:hypothetical protein [Catenuloplanes atrovinosus]MDR7277722.1 hypothetical protein [Catenuloplanes atrovinosus]
MGDAFMLPEADRLPEAPPWGGERIHDVPGVRRASGENCTPDPTARSVRHRPPATGNRQPATGNRQPTEQDMRDVLDQFGYESPFVIDNGHVWTHGLGEQRRYALQHTLRYQIWEIDQPHLLHAHGRSLTGHLPPEDQQYEFARIRDTFTQQIVTTDD